MTETLVNGYLSDSTQQELSNEYPHDSVKMIFKNLCVIVLLKVSSLSITRINFKACHTYVLCVYVL